MKSRIKNISIPKDCYKIVDLGNGKLRVYDFEKEYKKAPKYNIKLNEHDIWSILGALRRDILGFENGHPICDGASRAFCRIVEQFGKRGKK